MGDQPLREWALAWSSLYNVAHDDVLAPLHGRSYYSMGDINTILTWKLQPNYLVAARNTIASLPVDYVLDVVARAINNSDDLASYTLLAEIKGMQSGWAIASAILMASNPDRFTVYDRRALKSLSVSGLLQSDPSKGTWLNYLHSCRAVARRTLLPLRVVDRALYMANGSGVPPTGFQAPEPHWFGALP
jgi:hypothetical protein